MRVQKRKGNLQEVSRLKIHKRFSTLVQKFNFSFIDVDLLANKVYDGLYDLVETSSIDELASETAAYMSTEHPNYSNLAATISISKLHKETNPSFSATVENLYSHVSPQTKEPAPLVSRQLLAITREHGKLIDSRIKTERDFEFDFFGWKTLSRSYLLRKNGKVIERPQHLFMRVSLGIHGSNLEEAFQTYELMTDKWFIHASPTLFNSGTEHPQLSSCFLLTMKDDSIDGIYDTLKNCALISKNAGGIGFSVHNIRASGSYIRGTNGQSNGLIPMLRVFNDTAKYVDQGGAKRPGAFAVYLEPWHLDIFDFLNLKKNTGKEEARARDLFYALWIPDLFMKRVINNDKWSLFCPDECPELSKLWGSKFEEHYIRYEEQKKARATIDARELWIAILESQIETGTPYMLYKDACNGKSNHQHLGTITCSNLCTEIIQYSSPEEVAVCNLASVSLPRFVTQQDLTKPLTERFDHQKLFEIVKIITRNLNKIIDVNMYPLPEARRSNMNHRPIGIGVQGLADVFLKLRIPFTSQDARTLNREIFETIYFASLTSSAELAERDGAYSSYEGSPVSQGKLQFDCWNVTPSARWDWDGLREKIKITGLRNSLLVAPMPTASTSQIFGNTECFEPLTTNVYHRRVLSGDFVVINRYLVEDLQRLGLWTASMRNSLIAARGSVQDMKSIPQELREVYKTVWEIRQKSIIEMSADRSAFIDQSHSLNLHLTNPTFSRLSSLHYYSWSLGLKTGMYYLRTQAAASAIQFTVDHEKAREEKENQKASENQQEAQAAICWKVRGGPSVPDCVMCSS
eukprot:TRINITY_DN10252_c0_g1_i1.p1 TRINITY_DN10252_c0_g1~~TRINITY_DN10252_c0_g1_i1.p1  ORF type:complete len:803 (+),score=136.39 TRINITY_DN10252_c0_g1_i1:74-2482(+)